jgi:hypothetical protein
MRLSTAQIKTILTEFASEEPNALQSLIEFSFNHLDTSQKKASCTREAAGCPKCDQPHFLLRCGKKPA